MKVKKNKKSSGGLGTAQLSFIAIGAVLVLVGIGFFARWFLTKQDTANTKVGDGDGEVPQENQIDSMSPISANQKNMLL